MQAFWNTTTGLFICIFAGDFGQKQQII